MKRLASVLLAGVVLVALTASAAGQIGWCGGHYPNHGTSFSPIEDITIYARIWISGVTTPAGQAPGITADLYWRCVGDPSFNVTPMTYLGDVGEDDEYTATILGGHGCDEIECYVHFQYDDGTKVIYDCYAEDQNGHQPNHFYPISGLAQDVTVWFQLCLPEGIDSFFDVCVTGSRPELTNWSSPGVYMYQPCPVASPKLYEVGVTFPAGSSDFAEYKYQKDDCATWDCDPNHTVIIDDTNPDMYLPVDVWCWGVNDCPDCPSPVEDATWGTIKAIYK